MQAVDMSMQVHRGEAWKLTSRSQSRYLIKVSSKARKDCTWRHRLPTWSRLLWSGNFPSPAHLPKWESSRLKKAKKSSKCLHSNKRLQTLSNSTNNWQSTSSSRFQIGAL